MISFCGILESENQNAAKMRVSEQQALLWLSREKHRSDGVPKKSK